MKIPKPIRDRRRSIRIQETLPFTFGRHGYETEAMTVNISCHGVLCAVKEDIPIMTQLSLMFSIPVCAKTAIQRKKIRVKGVVVRKEKEPDGERFYLAIYFSRISEKDRTLLKKFIDSRMKE